MTDNYKNRRSLATMGALGIGFAVAIYLTTPKIVEKVYDYNCENIIGTVIREGSSDDEKGYSFDIQTKEGLVHLVPRGSKDEVRKMELDEIKIGKNVGFRRGNFYREKLSLGFEIDSNQDFYTGGNKIVQKNYKNIYPYRY